MSLTGGKRKVNKSLKAWVTFVKKVQKEEKLSYKDAIHRAKIRKDKGEKWMTGGDGEIMPIYGAEEDTSNDVINTPEEKKPIDVAIDVAEEDTVFTPEEENPNPIPMEGGKRRRRTMRRSRGRGRGRTARRSRRRSSRRH